MVIIRNLGHLGTPTPYQYSAEDLAEPPNESYGHKLRRLRLELAMSQGEVAAIVGCSKEAISSWERDKRMGNSTEAAQIPRRAIELLSQRLRRKKKLEELARAAAEVPKPTKRARRA
jgi:DNA-binding XRE family transcriptional regulator